MVNFKQINENYNIKNKYNLSIHLLTVFVFIVISIILIKNFNIHIDFIESFGFILVSLVMLIFKLYTDYSNNKNIIGNCSFDINEITFMQNKEIKKILTSEIESLKIIHYFIEDNSIFQKPKVMKALASLEVKTKSNQLFNIKLLSKNTTQIKDFSNIWKEYYKMGIKINEYYSEDKFKTILFKKINYSYKEMQDLKKELNVSSFY